MEDEAAAIAIGFNPPPPIYAVGTPVVRLGQKNFRKERNKVENLPLVEEAAQAIAQAIEEEEREDIPVEIKSIKLVVIPDAKGNPTLSASAGGETYLLEEQGYKTLCNLIGVGPQILAPPMNKPDRFRGALPKGLDYLQHLIGLTEKEITFRTRKANGHRATYAAVSKTYEAFDHGRMWRDVAEAWGGRGARGEALYNPEGTVATLTALWVPQIQPDQVVAGEFFKAGVTLRNGDDCRTGVQVLATLWRNLCLNLLIIAKLKISKSFRHVGSHMNDRVLAHALDMANQMGPIVGRWNDARKDQILEEGHVDEIETVLAKLVDFDIVPKPAGTSRSDFKAALFDAWLMEPGYDRAAIVNAVSRAAHEHVWASPEVGQQLETTAGALLMRPTLF